jgi:outer membrane protein
MEKNHQIEIARNNKTIAENSAFPGNAGFFPSIALSGGINYSDGQQGFGSADPSTQTSAQIQASYTLFDGFGNIYTYKRLQAGKKLGILEARAQMEATILEVSQAYFEAANAYENLEIAKELVEISTERLNRARKRSDYGRAMSVDVLSAQVDLNTDSVTLAQSGLRWDQARRELNLLLNRNVETLFRVDTLVVFQKQWSLEELKSRVFESNASYLISGQNVAQARYEQGSARAAHFPTVDLTASYGFSQTAPDLTIRMDDPGQSVRVGAAFTFSLFNGLKTTIQRQNAQLNLKNQILLEEQTRLSLEKDLSNAHQAFQNSLEVLALETRSLDVAELNFQRTRELYRLGQMTTTQFREAQLNLIRSKSALSAAKYEAKLNEIILMQLSGTLLEEMR